MGNPTAASTRNFQRHREYVIQYATGSAIRNKIAATIADKRIVSNKDCQSMGTTLALGIRHSHSAPTLRIQQPAINVKSDRGEGRLSADR